MDKYTGKRLDGRYEIHELIGVGGMALVYRAYDTIDDRTVAIKILKDEFLGNEEFIRRFKNESKAIAVLSHPSIVKVYDVSFGDRIQYIVEEYIDGITLKDYLEQQKQIPWKEAIHFTVQILNALQHAHQKGIVHRDIKPQNIMLLQDGTIKVTDFGIARFAHSETRTMTDKAIGSVHYIAPEQARGDVVDGKTDIYSVGVMLYEMLTGQLPFEADNAVSVAIMQLQADPRPPREINPDIPEGLEEITLKAMQKNPAQRYQSATEMLEDIAEFRKNPSIRFQYQYFQDEKPTKYIDAINNVRGNTDPAYNDNYEYEEVADTAAKKKNVAPLVIAGVLAAFLIVAVALGFAALFRGCQAEQPAEDIEVPNFIGQKAAEIYENEEYKKNFVFKEEQKQDSSKEVGEVLDQSPAEGMKVKPGAEITLYVNVGNTMQEIPDLTNYTKEDAEKILQDRNLVPNSIEIVDETVSEGHVVRTDPAKGESVAEGSTVNLYISGGPEDNTIAVPAEIIGMQLEDARKALTNLGFVVNATPKDDTGKEKGVVVECSPLPGTKLEKNSKVTLVYSSGKVTSVPNKKLEVAIPMPTNINRDVTLVAYIDGVIQEKQELNPSAVPGGFLSLTFENTGTHELRVMIDGELLARYTLNFDKGTYQENDYNHNLNAPESTGDNESTNITPEPPAPEQGT